MIVTIMRVALLDLLRDRVALALTFLLPLVFFSVFATVFASMDTAAVQTVKTIIVVDPESVFAEGLARRMSEKPDLEVTIQGPEDRDAALEAVRTGEAAAVLVLPSELRPTFLGDAGENARVELHADRSNPLTVSLVHGLLQASAAELHAATYLGPDGGRDAKAVQVEVIDALGGSGKRPSIAFFAAGLGVMFLMFAVTGRSAILLEERESGVLGRLLAARVGMSRLLLGHWLFLVILGMVQVLVMFLWAAIVFGLDLFTPGHLGGFAVTTAAIAAAAAAFGLVLSAACRTRAQLNGVAAVVILSLSVIGGSMFPDFLMSPGMRAIGRLTFNAWALGAYRKVFWYERPIRELAPEITGLVLITIVFLALARWIARGWERTGGTGR